MRVGLVGCVKSKLDRPTRAKDLYTSTLFAGRRRYVERTCDRWYVLSALYGLVDPDEVIEPYDVSLVDQNEASRAAWAAEVLEAIKGRMGDVRGVVFEVHAGAAYRDHGLVVGLRRLGAAVEVPAGGLKFGTQLAFYTAGSLAPVGRRGYSAVGELLAEQSSPVTLTFGELEAALGRPLPASARRHREWWGNTAQSPQARSWLQDGWRAFGVDLARERVSFDREAPRSRRRERRDPPPLVPGSEVPSCHVDSALEIGSFSYQWPDSTETFDSGWEAQVTVDGRKHGLKMGLDRQSLFGRERRHAVVFVDGTAVVEATGTDDYDVSRTLVSMVRVDRHDVLESRDLPPGYDGLDLVSHRDAVSGPGARRGLAVRLREDDVEGWSRHFAIRLNDKRGPGPPAQTDRQAPVTPRVRTSVAVARSVDPSAVLAALLDHGTRLAARDPGEPPKFTGDPEADRFLTGDPFAFLVAVIADQGIRAERAWRVPFELRRRLGYFGPQRIAAAPDELRHAFAGPPALHRLVNTIPTWVHLAAVRVLDDYSGDAGAIWGDEPTAAELQHRLQTFVGISQKKSAMATEILERDLGITVREMTGSDVAFDVHLRRVFLRCGLAQRDDLSHMVAAARAARPERPGSLDFPAWDIGRRWCRPTMPLCDSCAIGAVCPRLLTAGDDVRGM